MKFTRIEMLLLIWVAVLLFVVCLYGMRKRRRILKSYASVKSLAAVTVGFDPGMRHIKTALILCSLVFLAVAMTGPRYGFKWVEIEQRGVDIMIALDCSKSMTAQDIRPSRLDRAKREIFDLLNMVRGDRIGLAAFAGTAYLQCPLTLDYTVFHQFLNVLSPDFLPVGGTDIAGAVTACIDGFEKDSDTEKAIILITDGENTGDGDPEKAAEKAREAGIKLFTIGVGGETGVPIPDPSGGFRKDDAGNIVLTKLDEDTLKKIAVLTGGGYVRSVAGDMDLDVIYSREIRGKMEKSELSGGKKQVWEDRYQWFLALSILLLAVELFLPSSRNRNGLAAIALFLVLAALPNTVRAETPKDALRAYQSENYAKALNAYIEAQLDNPDKPEILYNIGNTYYKMEDYDNAEHYYMEALNAAKREEIKQKTYYNLGNTQFRKKKYEDALKYYDQALQIDPRDKDAEQNKAFVKRVMELQKQQQQQQQNGDEDGEKKPEDENQSDSGKDQQQESEKNPSDQNQSESAQNRQGEEDRKEASQPPETQPESAENENKPSETPESNQGENQDEAQAASQGKNGDETGEQQEAAAAQAADQDDSGESQAEKMLNRLRDKPEMALIPLNQEQESYGRRNVKKDW